MPKIGTFTSHKYCTIKNKMKFLSTQSAKICIMKYQHLQVSSVRCVFGKKVIAYPSSP